MTVQTRSEENGIREHDSMDKAFQAAAEDVSIWKISEGDTRLVRTSDGTWEYTSWKKVLEESMFKAPVV